MEIIVSAISAAVAFFGLALAMLRLASKQGEVLGRINQQLNEHEEGIENLWSAHHKQDGEIKKVKSKIDALEPMVATIHEQVAEIYKAYLKKGIRNEKL